MIFDIEIVKKRFLIEKILKFKNFIFEENYGEFLRENKDTGEKWKERNGEEMRKKSQNIKKINKQPKNHEKSTSK